MGSVTYYCSLMSPWSFLGAAKLGTVAAAAGATVDVRVVDMLALFKAAEAVLLPQRTQARKDYRMAELQRWNAKLGAAINVVPKHWPVDETRAAHLVIAAKAAGQDAFALATAFQRATWVEERDISDPAVQTAILTETGLDAAALEADIADPKWEAARQANTQAALEDGAFGLPWYVVGDERFWGQDRLDFVADALAR